MENFLTFIGDHWMLSSLFVALLVALIMHEKRRSGQSVTPQQAVMMLNRDEAIILDVRDKKDTAGGVIRGSVHIPFSSLKDRATELEKHKGKTIIVADKMGQHSGMAVRQLNAAGLENVQRLSGGIIEWQSANLPLSKR